LKSTISSLKKQEEEVMQVVNLFAKVMHEKHNEEKVIEDEEATSNHAFDIMNGVMEHMEKEE